VLLITEGNELRDVRRSALRPVICGNILLTKGFQPASIRARREWGSWSVTGMGDGYRRSQYKRRHRGPASFPVPHSSGTTAPKSLINSGRVFPSENPNSVGNGRRSLAGKNGYARTAHREAPFLGAARLSRRVDWAKEPAGVSSHLVVADRWSVTATLRALRPPPSTVECPPESRRIPLTERLHSVADHGLLRTLRSCITVCI
jgi:hypothetical protein